MLQAHYTLASGYQLQWYFIKIALCFDDMVINGHDRLCEKHVTNEVDISQDRYTDKFADRQSITLSAFKIVLVCVFKN